MPLMLSLQSSAKKAHDFRFRLDERSMLDFHLSQFTYYFKLSTIFLRYKLWSKLARSISVLTADFLSYSNCKTEASAELSERLAGEAGWALDVNKSTVLENSRKFDFFEFAKALWHNDRKNTTQNNSEDEKSRIKEKRKPKKVESAVCQLFSKRFSPKFWSCFRKVLVAKVRKLHKTAIFHQIKCIEFYF